MSAAVGLVAATQHAGGVDIAVFVVAAAIVLAGAVGVVVARNPVHSALFLVMTLFGVAVLFVEQQANFLAAVQVIVYAGAVVVLFLFVIMFLGVDREENVAAEPLRGQRPLALALVILAATGLVLLGQVSHWVTGAKSVAGPATGASNVQLLGQSVFTTYLFPFEATAGLLIIAVVGAVALARRPSGPARPDDELSANDAEEGPSEPAVPAVPAAEPVGAEAAPGAGTPDRGEPAGAPAAGVEEGVR